MHARAWSPRIPFGRGLVAARLPALETRRFLIQLSAIAIAGLALRLGTIAAVGFDVGTFDVDGYHWQAMERVEGRPIPTDVHPAGYPFLLSAFYGIAGIRPRLFYGLQAVLGVSSVLLVGIAASRRWGERAGLFAATLLALNGYLATFTPVLASENLAVFAIALLVWLALPHWPNVTLPRLLASAALVGGLAFVRTSFVAVAGVLVLKPLFRAGFGPGRRWAALALASTVGTTRRRPAGSTPCPTDLRRMRRGPRASHAG